MKDREGEDKEGGVSAPSGGRLCVAEREEIHLISARLPQKPPRLLIRDPNPRLDQDPAHQSILVTTETLL